MSVPNLREPGKLLRQNFILREVTPTGAALFSYKFTTPSEAPPWVYSGYGVLSSGVFTPNIPASDWAINEFAGCAIKLGGLSYSIISNTLTSVLIAAPPVDGTYAWVLQSFNLPATYKIFLNDYWVDFPTLPIMDFYDFYATAADITYTVNGQSHTVTGLNPITGAVTIADLDVTEKVGEIFTLTDQNIEECEFLLPGYITSPENAEFTIIHGTSQFIYKDFKVNGQHVTWYFSDLKELLQAGDQIRVSYTVTPVNAEIEFLYHIRNSAVIKMVDRDLSRIMDDKYVFGGLCYDQEGVELNVMLNE
jgi:hypothetical protein